MDTQELSEIKQRVAQAEAAATRVDRLQKAITDIDSGHVCGIQIDWRKLKDVKYIPGDSLRDDPWCNVCWAKQEQGLVDELKSAFREVVNKRLLEAQDHFQKL